MIYNLFKAILPSWSKTFLRDCSCVLYLIVSWVLYKVYPKNPLWIISERGTDAQDNGYWMFKYMKLQHPEIKSYYIISKDSKDRKKLEEWEDSLIENDSLVHYVRMWQATHIVTAHLEAGYPSWIRDRKWIFSVVRSISRKKWVWLQHGVIKDDIPFFHYKKHLDMDIFVCGAKPEYDYVKEVYGYRPDVYQYTGLARFDGLHDYTVNKGQILVMPTFRWWLDNMDQQEFQNSLYCRTYIDFLTNPQLHEMLRKNHLKLIFYPHANFQRFIREFLHLQLPEEVIVADRAKYDVQSLLKTSELLVTDFSSIFFDFAYMRKPVIYFQFDEKQYRDGHYKQGYYDYHDGLGPWTSTIEELLDEIRLSVEADFQLQGKYLQRAQEFFPLYDTQNCERIYQAICRLD